MTQAEFVASRQHLHGPVHPTPEEFTAQFNLIDTRVNTVPGDGLYTCDDIRYFYGFYDANSEL